MDSCLDELPLIQLCPCSKERWKASGQQISDSALNQLDSWPSFTSMSYANFGKIYWPVNLVKKQNITSMEEAAFILPSSYYAPQGNHYPDFDAPILALPISVL